MLRRFALVTFAAVLATVALARVSLSQELVMFEQPGCHWCERWDAQIAPIYPLTPEGKAAPLRRLDIHATLPDGLTLARPAIFTPTFVLIRDGQELARIEGYPGEDFFWGLLGMMLAEHIDIDRAS